MEKGHKQHLEIQARLIIDLDTLLKNERDISKFSSLASEVVINMLSTCCESTLFTYCAILSEIMRHVTNDNKFGECRDNFLSWLEELDNSVNSDKDKEVN